MGVGETLTTPPRTGGVEAPHPLGKRGPRGPQHSVRRRRPDRRGWPQAVHHREAAVLLHPRRRPGFRDLRPHRSGRCGGGWRLLDRVRGRRLGRGHHRDGVRRAGDQVPPGGRFLALRPEGVRQQGAHLPGDGVLPRRELRRLGLAGRRLRVVLLRALGRPAGAARVSRLRGCPRAHQLHRHHRVGGDEHVDDLRRAQRPDHRADHRRHTTSPRATPTSARSPTSASPATRRWRSSPGWRSPSSR